MKIREWIAADIRQTTWRGFFSSLIYVALVPCIIVGGGFYINNLQQKSIDARFRAINIQLRFLEEKNSQLSDQIRWDKYLDSLKPGEQPRWVMFGIRRIPMPPLPAKKNGGHK